MGYSRYTGSLSGSSGGSGGVSGPASSTDNAIALWDGTSGDSLKNSGITVSAVGAIAGVQNLSASGTVTLSALTASRALISNGSSEVAVSATTSTELGYVSGVTSSIQSQLNGKATNTLADGSIFIGNASNEATAQAVTGDIAITNSGVTSISSGVIVNADVNNSAAIAYSKLDLAGSIVNADVNSSAAIAYSKLDLSDSIVNADINSSAAIAYSKLNLSGSILNADINSSADIAYSKLDLAGSIVNADVDASAAIAYSKLDLAGSIVNADIGTSAAIAYSKLAALTASRALVSDGSGLVSVSAITATELGYLDNATSNIQSQIDDLSDGDFYADGSVTGLSAATVTDVTGASVALQAGTYVATFGGLLRSSFSAAPSQVFGRFELWDSSARISEGPPSAPLPYGLGGSSSTGEARLSETYKFTLASSDTVRLRAVIGESGGTNTGRDVENSFLYIKKWQGS